MFSQSRAHVFHNCLKPIQALSFPVPSLGAEQKARWPGLPLMAPCPHYSDLGGYQRGNKYLSLTLSVAFQKFSLKTDDGTKNGHNLQESFVLTPPRTHLLLL